MFAQNAERVRLIEQIHGTPTEVVLAITGGGSRLISELLEVPGASRTVLEATVPYAAQAMAAWLGSRPERYCAVETARMMAVAAFERARRYCERQSGTAEPPWRDLAGFGLTASLVSDRPKRGPHRFHAALQTAERTMTCSLVLEKGTRTRPQEEYIAATVGLNLLAEACGLEQHLELPLRAGEAIERDEMIAPPAWRDLLLGRRRVVRRRQAEQPRPGEHVVFPGAFNPLHEGHRRMAEVASEMLGRPTEFEISIANVDKPLLDFITMAQREAQFAPEQVLWFSRAARFIEKAEIFPGGVFVVGADTIVRIGDPRYYEGDPAHRDAAIERLAATGCRFLVFGRKTDAGFQTLSDLDLPPRLRELCIEVPASRFRLDISSTEIRAARHDD